MPIEKQVLVVYAANNGYVDAYPVGAVKRFETELLSFMESKHGQLLGDLKAKKAIDAELEGRIKSALEEFKGQFVA
jgi:F-type H+-transporting ATPase subunit alpha